MLRDLCQVTQRSVVHHTVHFPCPLQRQDSAGTIQAIGTHMGCCNILLREVLGEGKKKTGVSLGDQYVCICIPNLFVFVYCCLNSGVLRGGGGGRGGGGTGTRAHVPF
jgi:hypothetical protein